MGLGLGGEGGREVLTKIGEERRREEEEKRGGPAVVTDDRRIINPQPSPVISISKINPLLGGLLFYSFNDENLYHRGDGGRSVIHWLRCNSTSNTLPTPPHPTPPHPTPPTLSPPLSTCSGDHEGRENASSRQGSHYSPSSRSSSSSSLSMPPFRCTLTETTLLFPKRPDTCSNIAVIVESETFSLICPRCAFCTRLIFTIPASSGLTSSTRFKRSNADGVHI